MTKCEYCGDKLPNSPDYIIIHQNYHILKLLDALVGVHNK
jgi:hypothetical protein